MKQVQILGLLAFLMILFSACTKNTTCSKAPLPENKPGFVQLIHACPALPGIKLWQGESSLQSVGNYYKSNTHYIPVIAGPVAFSVKRSANNLLLASYDNQLMPNEYYSLFATCDSLYNFIPLLIQDKPLPNDDSKAQLRIVNILSTAESIEVTLSDKSVEQMDARQNSPYRYYSPGQLTLSVKNSRNNSSILKNVLLSLDAGRNYTLYINGFSNQTGAFGADAILMVNH
jgi:hypothetical protein